MDKRKEFVKVQLKDVQMTELYRVYDQLHKSYNINSRHDLLLLAHISELRDKLRHKVGTCARKYTLLLQGTELLAFVQLWEPAKIEITPFVAQIIQMIFNNMDSTIKNKRIVYANHDD